MASGAGWSLPTTASPPSSCRASRAKPPLSRSAKKPTAVSAATASVTASASRRNSPARKSRASWRAASAHQSGGRRRAGAGVVMQEGAGRSCHDDNAAAQAAGPARGHAQAPAERVPCNVRANAPARSRAVLQCGDGHAFALRLARLADDRARARRGRRLPAAPRPGDRRRLRPAPRGARHLGAHHRARAGAAGRGAARRRCTTSAASRTRCTRCATTPRARPRWQARSRPLLGRGRHRRVTRLEQGGLDHGIWTVLRYLYPHADVPVLPLALVPGLPPAQLFALGEALAALRSQGVLVLGSGSITHNLRLVFAQPAAREAAGFTAPTPRTAPRCPRAAPSATGWPSAALPATGKPCSTTARRAPHAALMHPTDEHLLPWYPAAGAGRQRRDAASPATRASTLGCLGMDSYAFGPRAAALRGRRALRRRCARRRAGACVSRSPSIPASPRAPPPPGGATRRATRPPG